MSVDAAERPQKTSVGGTSAAHSFGETLSKALTEVDGLQQQGDAESNKVAHGGGNLHELALTLEKADVAMRVAVKVRSKLVDAYNEVMRMSI